MHIAETLEKRIWIDKRKHHKIRRGACEGIEEEA
jgi:hypothetical protein